MAAIDSEESRWPAMNSQGRQGASAWRGRSPSWPRRRSALRTNSTGSANAGVTSKASGLTGGGRELAALHLRYETCEEYPLELVFEHVGGPRPEHYRIGERAMRYADNEKTVLIVNEHIRLAGIPVEAHRYEVNGRTPLEWFIGRYKVTQDKGSGIVNDPNGWFDDPRDLIVAIRRIVYVSVETVSIVAGLPEPIGLWN